MIKFPVSHKRPSWDEYFMNIARETAKRATCRKRQFGAVIVGDKRIVATGYNGAPAGLTHCLDAGCYEITGHCVRPLHAEENAILQVAMQSQSLRSFKDLTIYVSGGRRPCLHCAKMLIGVGIKRIVYDKIETPDIHAEEYKLVNKFLKEAGIQSEEVSGKHEKN